MVLNSNLQVPIPETASFSRFEVMQRPPLARQSPIKSPILFKIRLLSHKFFIYPLDFPKLFQNVETFVMNV